MVGGGLVRQVGGRGQVDGWSGRWLVGQVAGGLLGGWVMAGLIGYIEHLNLVGVDVNFPLHVIFLRGDVQKKKTLSKLRLTPSLLP